MSNNSREDKTSSKGKYWSFRVVQTWHIKWTVDRSSSYTEGAWPYPMLSHPWLDYVKHWHLHHESCMMFVRHCSWRVSRMLEQTSDQECVIRLWCCGRKSIYAFSIYNLTVWLWKYVGSRIPQLTMKDVECQGHDDYVVMSAWDPVVHSADKVMLSWWYRQPYFKDLCSVDCKYFCVATETCRRD